MQTQGASFIPSVDFTYLSYCLLLRLQPHSKENQSLDITLLCIYAFILLPFYLKSLHFSDVTLIFLALHTGAVH